MSTSPLSEYEPGKFFEDVSNRRYSACVGVNGGPYDFDAFASGYFIAYERLRDSISKSPEYIDLLIYPTLNLFRHGLELSLKGFVVEFADVLESATAPSLSHRLLDDWRTVREILSRIPPVSQESSVIEGFESLLKDILTLDPRGIAFRYPEKQDRSPTEINDHTHLHLPNIDKWFDAMRQQLDAWKRGIHYWKYSVRLDDVRSRVRDGRIVLGIDHTLVEGIARLAELAFPVPDEASPMFTFDTPFISREDTPAENDFAQAIGKLSREEKESLFALYLIGRGDGIDYDGLLHAAKARGEHLDDAIHEKASSFRYSLPKALSLLDLTDT